MKKDDKKPIYILCPRCELNYINKKDKYCTVCKAEMGLLDPSILIPDEEEVGVEKLCPVCQLNYIGEDEEICFLCQKERDEKEKANELDEWKEFSLDHTAGGVDVDIDAGVLPLGDDEIPFVVGDEDEEEEDEFVPVSEPDDFEFDVDPDDFVEDEEDEDEEEDDDF